MPTDDHLAWFVMGICTVLIFQAIGNGLSIFLKWRSARRG